MSADLELTDDLAPPMANGEVLFDAPWQGRAFGMARTLAQAGVFSWDEFRRHLIRIIGVADREADAADEDAADEDAADEDVADEDVADEYEYYQHFLGALEAVLAEKDLLDSDLLAGRIAEFQARPHDHDHDHHH